MQHIATFDCSLGVPADVSVLGHGSNQGLRSLTEGKGWKAKNERNSTMHMQTESEEKRNSTAGAQPESEE